MATFEVQVEGLTGLSIGSSGTTPTQAELTEFLKDGVIEVTNRILSINSEDFSNFTRTSSESTSQGGLGAGIGHVISVVRESGTNNDWRGCLEIPTELQSRVTDPNSLNYSSKFSPTYTVGGDGSILVFPAPDTGGTDSYKLYYVNDIPVNSSDASLTYAHSDINYFPANKVYLVVIYAAIKSLEAKMAEYAVEEEDLELVQAIASNLSSLKQQYDTAFIIKNYPKSVNAMNSKEDN